jgi:hypothetical protein
MPYCYYTCNLLPLGLVADAGYSPRWLGNHLRDPGAPARRDALSVHPMTCPYVTKLVAAAEEVLGTHDGSPGSSADCLVVPGGCDAMRRMGDLLAATYPGRAFVIHMPRSSGPDVIAHLAADLTRLDGWLRNRLPAGAASNAAVEPAQPPTLEYAKPTRPGGVFVVSGPLSNDSLLGLIDKLGSHVSGLESCTSPDRWKPLAPGAASGTTDYQALAESTLAAGMCPRRSTHDRWDYLNRRLDEAKPASIIYTRQSFCDPGAYDALLVSHLARERQLPYLEIEVDFPFDANGPLRVRVEAFLEAQLMDDDLLSTDDLFDEL